MSDQNATTKKSPKKSTKKPAAKEPASTKPVTAKPIVAMPSAATKPTPNCDTLEWADRNLTMTSSCIGDVSKKCLETKLDATCHRAKTLKDMYLQLLEQPELLSGMFWRREAACKAHSAFYEVLELPLFRTRGIDQEWNLKMSRICRLTTPLAQSVERLCANSPTPADITDLKGRFPLIDTSAGRDVVCYKAVGGLSTQIIDAYCAAGFSKVCWSAFVPSIDTTEPASNYEAKVKELCQKTPNAACVETEALKTFQEIYVKKKQADADVATQTKTLLAELNLPKGQVVTLNFETDPAAYNTMISKLTKANEALYRHAKSDNRNGVTSELFTLPLYNERVRVPVLGCGAPSTSEVPSKNQGKMVRMLSYSCSPHNRFRLALTGDPDMLGKRLGSFPDPGPRENWVEGTVIGFRTTGVVTELVVAID